MGLSLTAAAAIVSAVAGVAGVTTGVIQSEEAKKRGKKASDIAEKKATELKRKDQPKSGQRLLGGKPSLG